MLAKVLWATILTTMTAGAAALATRLASRGWRAVRHEEPPALSRTLQRLLRSPLEKRLAIRLGR